MAILDFLYFLLLLATWPWLLKYAVRRRYRSLLKERLRPPADLPPGRPIWIHAVSVGEVRSLRALIAALRRQGEPLVLSATTPAGLDLARRDYPGIATIHAPIDLSFVVRRFIERIDPRLVVFNELEVWPNWIAVLQRRRIPMLLINGRISEPAFRRYRRFGLILAPFFRRIDLFLVQSDLYRRRFAALGIPPQRIEVCGNIKADEAADSLTHMPPAADVLACLNLPLSGRKLAVLASSHEADEAVFMPAIPSQAAAFLFVIAPRHVERATAIVSRLRQLGVRAEAYSRLGEGAAVDAVVYDRLGQLFPLLSVADAVFMGGTFDPATGGHNLYEPAALGKVIAGGPCCGNFPDIARDLGERGAYFLVRDAQEWRRFLAAFASLDHRAIGERARAAVANCRGALACSLKAIARLSA